MRNKEEKLVVTFKSATDAMAMERTCKKNNIPGRIVPVPRTIAVSCGLCWICPKTDELSVKEAIAEFKLKIDMFNYREMF